MTSGTDIADYNAALEDSHREIAEALQQLIDRHVPDAAGKVWHGHPVGLRKPALAHAAR